MAYRPATPARTRWVDDGTFAAVVRDGSHERMTVAAFAVRGHPIHDALERVLIDRAGAFALALIPPDAAPRALRECAVEATPAVAVIRDGEVVQRYTGEDVVGALRRWLDEMLPAEAERLAQRADEWHALGSPGAKELYERALACDPGCARALLGLARDGMRRGDMARALALATRVPSDDPLAAEARALATEARPHVPREGEASVERWRDAVRFRRRDRRPRMPRPTAPRTSSDVLPRLASGIVGGLIATVPMTLAMEAMHRRLPWRQQYPLPPREITENVERRVLGARLPEEPETALTWLSHFGYGAATGGLYGLVADRTRLGPVSGGAVFGLAVWTASYLGWLPASGLFHTTAREPAPRIGLMIAAHLVYGTVTGVVTDALRRERR